MNSARIMVAPNGARKNKDDHSAIPLTIRELVNTASACFEAGADELHAHVRDEYGKHTLDAGLYRELLAELKPAVPDMTIQITTESVGQYNPQQQRDVVYKVIPEAVSVAVREMLIDPDISAVRKFYHWIREAEIDLQHILYSDEDVLWLEKLVNQGIIPDSNLSMLFVLGRYSKNLTSSPTDLDPFLAVRNASSLLSSSRFMVCAFGQQETDCLLASVKYGGDCRIGFENNLINPDGSTAVSNEERVSSLARLVK